MMSSQITDECAQRLVAGNKFKISKSNILIYSSCNQNNTFTQFDCFAFRTANDQKNREQTDTIMYRETFAEMHSVALLPKLIGGNENTGSCQP